jgi:hypothetical protein
MSDELIKRVSGVLLGKLRESGAFVDEESTATGLPLIEGFVDLDKLAEAAIEAVVEHQTAEIIKQMKASPNTEALHDEIEQLQLYVRNYVNASFPAPR